MTLICVCCKNNNVKTLNEGTEVIVDTTIVTQIDTIASINLTDTTNAE